MTRNYLDTVSQRIERNRKFRDSTERNVRTFGCLVGGIWLVGVVLSFLTSLAIITGLVALCYYLCTGEFIAR